jgi:hypothetical protein
MTRVDLANEWLDDYRERVPERVLEMARLYVEEGLTYAVIGERYGISKQRVGQLLYPLGLTPQGERRQIERAQRLLIAYERIQAGETTLAEEAEALDYASTDSLRTRMHELGLKPRRVMPEPAHGTLTRYNSSRWRCRCAECRRANREANAALAGREPPEHGTISGYQNYACRCKLCKEAARVQARIRRAEKRRAKEAVTQ